MTLTAQHAMRLRLPLPLGNRVGYGVLLTQSVFGEPEQVPTGMQECSNTGLWQGNQGVFPGQYDVTVTRFGAGPQPASTHFTAASYWPAQPSYAKRAVPREATVAGSRHLYLITNPAGP